MIDMIMYLYDRKYLCSFLAADAAERATQSVFNLLIGLLTGIYGVALAAKMWVDVWVGTIYILAAAFRQSPAAAESVYASIILMGDTVWRAAHEVFLAIPD